MAEETNGNTPQEESPDKNAPNNGKDRKSSPLEYIHPASLARLADNVTALIKSKLWLKIIVALILGVGVGVLLGPSTGILAPKTGELIGEWLALPGYFFLAVIQMIVVLLVFSSVIRGIASNDDLSQLKKTGLGLIIYFLLTTAVAVVIGISTANLIRPGDYVDGSTLEQPEVDVEAQVTDAEAAAGTEGEAEDEGGFELKTVPQDVVSLLPNNPMSAMANSEMLQIVLFSIVFGIALISLPPKTAQPLLDLFGSLEAVCMAIVRWVMEIAPLAVFGLIAKVTLGTGIEVLAGLSVYVGAVIGGFLVLLVFYLIIVAILGRQNPFRFLGNIREPQLMAFSTNSSAAVMPLTLKTAVEKLNVRQSTAQFIVPIGATINMGGSALYQGIATVFVAQMYGIDLPTSALAALTVTAVGASIGTPATPGVGIIVLSSVLTSVGVPLEGLTLIIGLDRILELFRTTLNVTGDLVACVVMDRFSKPGKSDEELSERDKRLKEQRAASGEDTIISQPATG